MERLYGFDQRFDVFWEKLRTSSTQLLAVRSAAALAWHFDEKLRNDRAAALAMLGSDGEIAAYLILQRKDSGRLALLGYLVADLQVLGGREEIAIPVLLRAALDLASATGVHVVKTVGFSSQKYNVLRSLRPYRLRYTNPQYNFFRVNRSLEINLNDPAIWDASPIDGDAAF